MMKESKKHMAKNGKQSLKEERRSFLKKSVYAAPTLIVLGALMKPKSAEAGFGGTPSDPDDGSGTGW